MADNASQINANAQAPAQAASQDLSATAHPLAAQIQADRYAAAAASAKTPRRGLRFSKLIPAGAVSDRQGSATGGSDSGEGV